MPRALVFLRFDVIYGPDSCRAHLFFQGSISFTLGNTCFSKARCHLQCGKLLFSLVFRMLDVIYGAENCRAHLFLECSMSFAVRKIAVRTCFSKARCHLRCGKLTRALVFKGLISYMVRKSAFHTCFLKARCIYGS